MAKINFENKEDVKLSSLPRKNKVIATDMNEIKQSVNDLYDEKQDTLVSGTNIKTLNGDSLLGAGNITIISENLATNNLTQSDSTRDYNLGTGNRVLRWLAGTVEKIIFHTDGGNPTLTVNKTGNGQTARFRKLSGTGDAVDIEGGVLDMNSNKIVNVTDPTSNQDAATKKYVDDNSGARVYNGADVTPLTKRAKIRFTDFLGAVDDAINSETVVSLDTNITKDVNTNRFGLNALDEVDLKIPHERLTVGDVNGNATNLTGTEGNLIGFKEDNKITQFEGIEAFNILKETGITANKQLALIGIDGVASNLKATFIIDEILVINTTANSVVVSVGSTAGGIDIANAITIGANATVLCGLGTRYFSSTSGQNLFISSALWNSANVTISVTVKKVHYV